MYTISTNNKKASCLRKRLWGDAWAFTALLLLGRRLLLSRRSCRRGVGRQLLQIVLQEADFNTTASGALRLGLASRCGLCRGITHTDEVNAINRNVMIQHQVPHYRLGHFLRVGDGGLTVT